MSLVQQSSLGSVTQRWRRVLVRSLPQLGKFGVVGLIALVVDVGGFNLVRFAGGRGLLYEWPIAAKLLSASAATVVSWLGNRYWTFRHQRRSDAKREFVLFVVMCVIGTALALICLAVSHYVLRFTSPLADNISANVIGLALGTAFRFWAYRTHVFREPALPSRSQDAPLGEPVRTAPADHR